MLQPFFPIDPEVLKPPPKLHRSGSIIKEFSLNTSTHGIPSIPRSESIPNRIFWSISSVIFAGMMIYFIIQAFVLLLISIADIRVGDCRMASSIPCVDYLQLLFITK